METPDHERLERFLNTLNRKLPSALDRAIERASLRIYRILKEVTPKGLTGHLRNSWVIVKLEKGVRKIENTATITTFSGDRVRILTLLYYGTGIYGESGSAITPIVAKRLYVPLTRRAAFGWSSGLVWGKDYVLAKSVKGVRPTSETKVVDKVNGRVDSIIQDEIATELKALLR